VRTWRILGPVCWVLLHWLGCATGGAPLPTGVRAGEEQAVHIIWSEVYGRTDRPPLVRWIQGAALSCIDPASDKPGFPQWDFPAGLDQAAVQACHEGYTWSPLEVLVSWHGEASFSDTALAHELWHAADLRRFRSDAKHVGPEWVRIEECHEGAPPECGIVDRANREVVRAGR
jgi:hypothetical protein